MDEKLRLLESIHKDRAGSDFGLHKICSTCRVCQRRSKMPKKTTDLLPAGVPNRAFAQWGMDLVKRLSGVSVCSLMVLTEHLT